MEAFLSMRTEEEFFCLGLMSCCTVLKFLSFIEGRAENLGRLKTFLFVIGAEALVLTDLVE